MDIQRSRWVIQEAAFAENSVIFCGDRRVEMSDFAHAVGVVRWEADRELQPADDASRLRDQFLSNFRDSPATRLLDIIGTAFFPTESRRRSPRLSAIVPRDTHRPELVPRDEEAPRCHICASEPRQ